MADRAAGECAGQGLGPGGGGTHTVLLANFLALFISLIGGNLSSTFPREVWPGGRSARLEPTSQLSHALLRRP
jgi:hypothetical protein